MKDEVPPSLIESHVKMVEKATWEGKTVSSDYGIEQSGIAGTIPDKEEGMLELTVYGTLVDVWVKQAH